MEESASNGPPDDGAPPRNLSEPNIIGRSPSPPRRRAGFIQQGRAIARSPAFWGAVTAILFLVGLAVFVSVALTDPITGRNGLKPYSNVLYHFRIPDISGFDPEADSSVMTVQCKGVTLRYSACDTADPAECARLRVCFLDCADKVATGPAKCLADRVKEITSTLAANAQVGLPKLRPLGNERIPGRELTIEGKTQEPERLIRWRESVVVFRGRAYAVETICQPQDCERLAQALEKISNSLWFDPDVVTSDLRAAENR